MTENQQQLASEIDSIIFNMTLEKTIKRLNLERRNAVSALRCLCEEFGDNDWDNNLLLADIIEKHLGRHLRDDKENS